MKIKPLILSLLAVGLSHGQEAGEEKHDPYAGKGDILGQAPKAKLTKTAESEERHPAYVTLQYEVFSLPMSRLANIMRQGMEDKALYDHIVKLTETNRAKLEDFTIVNGRSGLQMTVESFVEEIYPIKYDPVQIPESVALGAPALPIEKDSKEDDVEAGQPTAVPVNSGQSLPSFEVKGLMTPSIPTAFETRNTGWSYNVEPTLGSEENALLDLRHIPEFVQKLGGNEWADGAFEMPTFHTQRLNTAMTVRLGEIALVGTLNPPMAGLTKSAEADVWVMFVLPKIKWIRYDK